MLVAGQAGASKKFKSILFNRVRSQMASRISSQKVAKKGIHGVHWLTS